MKKIIITIAAISFFSSLNVYAAGHVGQCVAPKTKPGKNGRLEFKKPIFLLSSPKSTDQQELKTFSSFTIKAEADGYIQLVTVPDYEKPDPEKSAGKVVGWAKLSDFEFQDMRNCN
ncbi:hypothetical protein ACO0LL_18755 [Undibacterium sp. TC4M20W]|uniref:hypothetical protein n=1 Tax=unclassified Undibacterium TaxID=2630295 RepID=UPI003BF003DC